MVGSKSYFVQSENLESKSMLPGICLSETSWQRCKIWIFLGPTEEFQNEILGLLGLQFPPQNSTGLQQIVSGSNLVDEEAGCCLVVVFLSFILSWWWRSPLWINLWCLEFQFQFNAISQTGFNCQS